MFGCGASICFLTGLVISVLSSWVSPWQSRFRFKFSHDAKFQTKELFGLCNVMQRLIKNESTSKIFLKSFIFHSKRALCAPASSAFSQYLYIATYLNSVSYKLSKILIQIFHISFKSGFVPASNAFFSVLVCCNTSILTPSLTYIGTYLYIVTDSFFV